VHDSVTLENVNNNIIVCRAAQRIHISIYRNTGSHNMTYHNIDVSKKHDMYQLFRGYKFESLSKKHNLFVLEVIATVMTSFIHSSV